MKKKIVIIALATILLISTFMSSAAKGNEFSWFIKRNGNNTPKFSANCNMIEKYNGFYIDKKSIETGKKVLYLTFDAGYENGNISKILDVLKEESVPSAFFILDNVILKNTELVKRMADEGHLVCNHTKNHRNLTGCSEAEIKKNLLDLERIYEEKTGKIMPKYFRFPEGRYSEEALKVISDMGYKTIFWSFAYDDWDNERQPSKEKAIKKILNNTHNGAIILLHPTSKTNAEILPEVIRAWKSMGYAFGTLDDLTK